MSLGDSDLDLSAYLLAATLIELRKENLGQFDRPRGPDAKALIASLPARPLGLEKGIQNLAVSSQIQSEISIKTCTFIATPPLSCRKPRVFRPGHLPRTITVSTIPCDAESKHMDYDGSQMHTRRLD
jgi:hypothetical protein